MIREHIVKDGVYIPDMGIEYPDDPAQRILLPVKIRNVIIDRNYPFLMKSFKEKFFHYIIYAAIFTVVPLIHWVRHDIRIEGRSNLKRNKKLFKNGAMTVCNHVYRWDFLAVLQAVGKRRVFFPALADNLCGKDAFLIRSAGGIPVPTDGRMGTARKFNEAFDRLHERRKWLHVFPEYCRWNWYEPVRPFKKGAFELAYRYNLPVIPMAISYRPVKGWRKLLGFKEPLITLRIGTPVIPDKNSKRKEDAIRMCKEAHAQVCELAGIIQDGWDPVSTS